MILDVLWFEYFENLKAYNSWNNQIFIQISYWVNLIPRNCAIAEWLTTCRHSDFWQNEHTFSRFTMLVTVWKGST